MLNRMLPTSQDLYPFNLTTHLVKRIRVSPR